MAVYFICSLMALGAESVNLAFRITEFTLIIISASFWTHTPVSTPLDSFLRPHHPPAPYLSPWSHDASFPAQFHSRADHSRERAAHGQTVGM